ncbi:hypothetical protein B1H18_08190 [Streptomyces tsukubensis]|uniref:Integral membrane protein n=1 Tax=Streptomyces tsukubensis TaxID=83656 RepID=A0A1V4AD87_9ACTN|nr:hypothetical protein B1H18_08190 [Streptomyces tsukubensis]
MRPTNSGDAPGGTPTTGGYLTEPPRPGRIAVYVLLLVVGAVTAVAGALVHAAWFPGGVLLALLAAAGVFYGGSCAMSAKAGAVVPAVGWLVTVFWLTSTRPEGDFVFGAGVLSYVFLLGGILVAVICATLARTAQPGGTAARLGK